MNCSSLRDYSESCRVDRVRQNRAIFRRLDSPLPERAVGVSSMPWRNVPERNHPFFMFSPMSKNRGEAERGIRNGEADAETEFINIGAREVRDNARAEN
jgi:hypothetical protein